MNCGSMTNGPEELPDMGIEVSVWCTINHCQVYPPPFDLANALLVSKGWKTGSAWFAAGNVTYKDSDCEDDSVAKIGNTNYKICSRHRELALPPH